MEDPARRRIMDAVMELKSSQEINFTDINFFRLKGNGQITLGKKEYKTRLDFRIQEKVCKNYGWIFLTHLLE